MSDSYGVEVFEIGERQVAVFDRGISSGEAYGITQCHDTIRDGCVLVLPAEGIVGVMIEAWPTQVTATPSEFHSLNPEYHLPERYTEPLQVARGIASAFDWVLA